MRAEALRAIEAEESVAQLKLPTMGVNGTYRKVRVATAQFYSHTDVTANVELSRKYIREAAAAGAQLIVLPENANRTRIDYKDRETAYQLSENLDGEYITGLCEAAKEFGIFIVAGVDLKTTVAPNVHVAVVLISKEGKVLYIHHKTVLVSIPLKRYDHVLMDLATVGLRVWALRSRFKRDRSHSNLPRKNWSPKLRGWDRSRSAPTVGSERS